LFLIEKSLNESWGSFFYELISKDFFAGMSIGGSVTAALKLRETLEKGVIVAIICDRGDRYIFSDLFTS
jgi:cysteine synthase B